MTYWGVLEKRSATAFLLAGAVLLAYTALLGIRLFTDLSPPEGLSGLLPSVGLLIALVGLLGFYPRLAGRVPQMARAGAVTVATAATAIAVLLAWQFGADALAAIPPPSSALFMPTVLLSALGFVLFGGAALWTDDPSRTVGALLLAIVGVNVAYLVAIAAVGGGTHPDWLDFAVTVVHPAVLLAVGYLLRAGSAGVDRAALAA